MNEFKMQTVYEYILSTSQTFITTYLLLIPKLFIFQVNLADVDDLQWIDKKQDGVIAVRVGTEDQLLLWSSKGLDNWMFALRDAVNLSKGRREALRRSQTLMPQLSDGGLIGRLVQNNNTTQNQNM